MGDAQKLDNVLTRLSLLKDEEFEGILPQVMTRCIGLLDKPTPEVQAKVMAVLSHVNKRLKLLDTVKLPVEDLLKQFQSSSGMVQNFALIYVEMGFSRCSAEETKRLLPRLFPNVHKFNDRQLETLLPIVSKGIRHAMVPPKVDLSDEVLKRDYAFLSDPECVEFVLDFLLTCLLYQPEASPAISARDRKRVEGKTPIKGSLLSDMKLGALSFVQSALFSDTQSYPHSLVAASDPHQTVASRGEEALKRGAKAVNFEDPKMIPILFKLFSGSPSNEKEATRGPVSVPAKTRILKAFSVSLVAANTFPKIVEVIFESLFGESSKQGRTSGKLVLAAAQLVQWTILHAKEMSVGPLFLNALVKVSGAKQTDLYASAMMYEKDLEEVVGLSWIGLGRLATRVPQIFDKDFEVIKRFFVAVASETPSIRVYVQEGLSSMCAAFEKNGGLQDVETRGKVTALLQKSIVEPFYQARFSAVQWANRIFPFSNVPARFVCVVGSGDSKVDVQEEALKGLRPGKGEDGKILPYPSFVETMGFVNGEMVKNSGKVDAAGRPQLSFPAPVMEQCIRFVHKCLQQSSGVDPNARFQDLDETDVRLEPYLSSLYTRPQSTLEKQAFDAYIKLLDQGVSPVASSRLATLASRRLLEVVEFFPQLAESYRPRLAELQQFVYQPGNEEAVREAAAALVGHVLYNTATEDDIKTWVSSFADELAEENPLNPKLDMKHGALHALGHLIARAAVPNPELAQTEPFQKAYKQMFERLHHKNPMVAAAACSAWGRVGKLGRLPLADGAVEKTEPTQKKAKLEENEIPTTALVIDGITGLLKLSNNKLLETTATVLRWIVEGDPNGKFKEPILDSLFATSRIRHTEMHFFVGEALAQLFKSFEEKEGIELVLKPLMTKHISTGDNHMRSAGCLWLLSVVKHAGTVPSIQRNLKDVQRAFVRLLSDNNDFTQETAGKGLALVYEIGDQATKESLLEAIVSTLSTGKKQVLQVDEDSEIFPEGTLGEAPEGGGISTYKELCSIANDMNQPDLIYKFLNLASSNAAWNTRKGAAFSMTSLLSMTEGAVDPRLVELIPKLYRYQYDPNQKVQEAMTQIWKAIVKDPVETISQHYSAIVREILPSIGSRLWRVREASCLALADLLSGGRKMKDVKDNLEEIWVMVFRGLDDIKESVRKAAVTACRSLCNLSVKLCSLEYSTKEDAAKALQIVLPYLLKKGIMSEAEEVRAVSVKQISNIVSNTNGELLKPHVPMLVSVLLESLSALESSTLNYVQFHVKDEASQEDLERMRVSASKNSEMSEALDKSMRYIDNSNIGEVVPPVIALIRQGVGLSTMVGCAKFVVGLTDFPESSAYAPKLLPALVHALSDASPTIRKAFASSLGYYLRMAKGQQAVIKTTIESLIKLYRRPEEHLRAISGQAFRDATRHSQSVVQDYQDLILPIAYVARQDASQEIKDIWSDVWDENTSGVGSVTLLYKKEILSEILLGFDASLLEVKRQSAKTLQEFAQACRTDFKDEVPVVLKVLLDAIPGRLWEGKEALLEAVAEIAIVGKDTIASWTSAQGGLPFQDIQSLMLLLLNETQRGKREWKEKGLSSLLSLLTGVECSAERVLREGGDTLYALATLKNEKQETSDDDDEAALNKRKSHILRSLAVNCIEKCWSKKGDISSELAVKALDFILAQIPKEYWEVKTSLLQALNQVLDSLKDESVYTAESVATLVSSIVGAFDDLKYKSVRTWACRSLQSLIKSSRDLGKYELVKEHASTIIGKLPLEDNEASVQALAQDIKKELQ